MKSTQAAFTLIELMVSMLILSILLMITTPSFGNLLAQNRQSNHISLIKTTLATARGTAISHDTSVTICPLDGPQCTNNWHEEIYVFIDANHNKFFDSDDFIIGMIESIPKSDSLTYPRNAVTYRADASIAGFQSGSFVYCIKDKPEILGKRITVSQAGRYRTRDTDCQGK